MKNKNNILSVIINALSGRWIILFGCVGLNQPIALANIDNPLPSWREGNTKSAITYFVEEVTDPNSAKFVAPNERIVVTDNDGTLWAEKPLYPQVAFLFDQAHRKHAINQLDPNDKLLQAVITANYGYLQGLDKQQLLEGLLAPVVGQPVQHYSEQGFNFLQSALHPRYKQPFSQVTYQPMQELLDYLRAKQFTVYIVTGGGEDFVSGLSQQLYDVPPSRVLGTRTKNFIDENGAGIHKGNKLVDGMNEGKRKVKQITERIGITPLIAIGNSTGDLDMLAHVDMNRDHSLSILLKHDDGEREYEYTKGAEKALARATESNWLVVSMKQDFDTVFSFQSAQ